MSDLIEALTILNKYVKADVHNPTHCEHDVFMVCCVNPLDVSKADKDRLRKLGFTVDSELECFSSFRFGAC